MGKGLKNLHWVVFITLGCMLMIRCTDDAPVIPKSASSEGAENTESTPISAPAFNGDSAYAYVANQVEFGPRVPNSDSHVACGDWLAAELTRHGAEVIEQPGRVRAFDGTVLEIRNIIGQYRPENPERIMLFAHWDTRPFADKDTIRIREPIDGANDGASGVGVLLEIARILGQDTTLDVGIDIMFFDAEDYGAPEWAKPNVNSALTWCLGSQFWANQPHRIGYRAKYGILLDMVGAENAVFNKEGTSMAYAPSLVRKIWSSAAYLGYQNFFQTNVTPETIDDNLFISEFAGIPSANIVHYQVEVIPMGYGPFHHTHADNLEIISKTTLEAVGNTVLHVVWND
ncbi:MAG: M28 family peptidase [Bacteroidetes bacterium]|nr:M28 family peptidase [Bacteroidota bacterium]